MLLLLKEKQQLTLKSKCWRGLGEKRVQAHSPKHEKSSQKAQGCFCFLLPAKLILLGGCGEGPSCRSPIAHPTFHTSPFRDRDLLQSLRIPGGNKEGRKDRN